MYKSYTFAFEKTEVTVSFMKTVQGNPVQFRS